MQGCFWNTACNIFSVWSFRKPRGNKASVWSFWARPSSLCLAVRIPVSGVAPQCFSWGLAGAYQVQAEVAGLPGPTSERRLNCASLSHSLSGFRKCLTCREGQAPSESVHRSLHAAVSTSEKQNANIPTDEAKNHLTLFHLTKSLSVHLFLFFGCTLWHTRA